MSLPKIEFTVALAELLRDADARNDRADVAFYMDLTERVAKAVDTFNGRYDLQEAFKDANKPVPSTELEIINMSYAGQRDRVFDQARQLVRELDSSAKMIAKAVETGDLTRLAWLTCTHDVELSTRATMLHENLHLVASFKKES